VSCIHETVYAWAADERRPVSEDGHAPYDADDAGGGTVQPGAPDSWDARRIRALRTRLGLTQAGLADRLGTRQQTVSEWETGASSPRRMSRRLLRMVAEDASVYDAGPNPGDNPAEDEDTAPGGPGDTSDDRRGGGGGARTDTSP